MKISKRKFTSLVDSLRDFPKTFDPASKCIEITLPKPKLEIGSKKSNDNLFFVTITIILNIQIGKFDYRSDLETAVLAYFPTKSLKYTAINLFSQKLSVLTNAIFTISTTTHITLQTSVKDLGANTMCSAFTTACGYDNSAINLMEDCIVRKQSVWVFSDCTKRPFSLSAEAIINIRNALLCARCAIFLLKIKQILFLSFGQGGLHFSEERPKSIQDAFGDVNRPGKYCFNREKCESLDGYVTTPRTILVVEIVEPGFLLIKIFLRYRSMERPQKQTNFTFSLLK